MEVEYNTRDVYSVDEIKDRLTPVFRQYGVRRAVLFGSYARGEARPVSDVDLLVDSGLMGLAFYGFGYDVEQALRKEIDLIDTCEVINDSRIDREIQNTGVQIYAA
ncbi:MAG: nucleotidyltransferase domain-containing protein [Oscillospiraceae bacterium]|nr:nucleotidyltransferase domain-containing protein [Oscillospiraceae bacterium]